MKKLVLAAMMAVSCTFAFADSNYRSVDVPNWMIISVDGVPSVYYDGSLCEFTFVTFDDYGHYSEWCRSICGGN